MAADRGFQSMLESGSVRTVADDRPRVGILALQGDFEAHARILNALGAEPVEVRVPDELNGLDALIIPGGESTVMTLGIEREGMVEPLRQLAASGIPVLGTCAGMIMLDRDHLGVLDVTTRRNAFGRQLRSFEADLDLGGLDGGKLRAIFIRAPWVEEYGPAVEVLASVDGHPVAIRQGRLLAVAFHPELSGETRIHQLLLAMRNGRADPHEQGAAGAPLRPSRCEPDRESVPRMH